jgi:hypothetical protein
MRIRVISDGTLPHTRIYDAETGRDLTKVLPCSIIKWEMAASNHIAKAELTVLLTQVEVIAELERIKVIDPGIVITHERIEHGNQASG